MPTLKVDALGSSMFGSADQARMLPDMVENSLMYCDNISKVRLQFLDYLLDFRIAANVEI